jgi:hypothetical protein
MMQVQGAAYESAPLVTRPANTTAYSANDVVGGVITFSGLGPAGEGRVIVSAALRYDVAAVPAGMANMRLYLYSVTPPSALDDNAAWDLPSGDRAAFIGYVDLGTPVDLGSTLFVQQDNLNKLIKLDGAENTLYGYLVTTGGGYTPAANSETFRVTLRTRAV